MSALTDGFAAYAVGMAAAALMLGGLAYALTPRWGAAASAALVLAPLIAYGALGRPDLPDAPLAARLAPPTDSKAEMETLSLAEAAARLEAHLRAHPNEPQGWNLLARTRVAQGEEARAQMAWARVLALKAGAEAHARAHLGFAEAQIRARDGLVDEVAAAHLRAVLALQEGAQERAQEEILQEGALQDNVNAARYWLGLRAWQAGDAAQARALWEAARAASSDPILAQSLQKALAELPQP